jgi:hypothetical protein
MFAREAMLIEAGLMSARLLFAAEVKIIISEHLASFLTCLLVSSWRPSTNR